MNQVVRAVVGADVEVPDRCVLVWLGEFHRLGGTRRDGKGDGECKGFTLNILLPAKNE
jgi:hypothetical protein